MAENINNHIKFAIRFGLGAIKAVGIGAMQEVVKEREREKFSDIYNFSSRIDAKFINKKSIEALSKAGAFDCFAENRRQIAESFDILSAYSNQKKTAKSSSQIDFFGQIALRDDKPKLKNIPDWNVQEKLQNEFDAFGFFLNNHPIDEVKEQLQKRGVVFSNKIEKDELQDGDIIKMAGVVVSSKHRSGNRGRFAYLNLSDIYGVFEVMIFDESLITESRDLIIDGAKIVLENSVRKDDGGIRMSVKKIIALDNFLKNTTAKSEIFEDIQKAPKKSFFQNNSANSYKKNSNSLEDKNYSQNNLKNLEQNNITTNQQKLLNKNNIVKMLEITISQRLVVFNLKSFLQQKLLPSFAENNQNSTQIFILVEYNGKITKIDLVNQYLIDENDIKKLKLIPDILNIQFSYHS